MNAIVLFLAQDVTAEDLVRELSREFEKVVLQEADRAVYVHRDDSDVRIEEAPDIDRDYGPGGLDRVRPIVARFRAWTAEYLDIELVKDEARVILSAYPGAVDNDCGWVGSGRAFLKTLKARPEWDWRLHLNLEES